MKNVLNDLTIKDTSIISFSLAEEMINAAIVNNEIIPSKIMKDRDRLGRCRYFIEILNKDEVSSIFYVPEDHISMKILMHEIGHAKCAKVRLDADELSFFRWFEEETIRQRIARIFGIEYHYEKIAWMLTQYFHTNICKVALRSYRLIQLSAIFDFVMNVLIFLAIALAIGYVIH